jgi:hypothetical protein
MPERFHLDVIRKSANELLDHIQSYAEQLRDDGSLQAKLEFLLLCEWFAKRIVEIVETIKED